MHSQSQVWAMKAITIGSATLDIIATIANEDIEQMSLTNQTATFLLMEPGRKVDAQSITAHTGGGAVNVAISLKKQGFDVYPLVKLGNDINAQKIRERFKEEGIQQDLICTHETEATAVSLLIASHDRNAAIFTHRGANGYLNEDDITENTFENADLVYVTNLSNASADHFPEIVNQGKKAGAFVTVNPGILQLTNKTTPFFDSLKHVDFFISNIDEAHALVPKLVERTGWEKNDICDTVDEPCLSVQGFRLTLRHYANRLHSLGPRYVGVTDGGNGAYLFDNGKLIYQPVIPTKVAGTTGAGDSFASTLSGSLVLGDSPEKALKLAAYNAASVVSYVDAQSGLLNRETLLNRL